MTSEWPEVALGEVCLITMGQAPSGESYNSEGDGWPLISGAGDFHNGLPKAKKFTSVKTKLCEPGDIVLGIRASIGSKVLADKIYCLGRGVAGLRASVDLEERYLWHWLDAVAEDLAAQGRGATFKQVNKNDVAELKIPLPPLDEQRRIAAILDKADEVRSKRKAALETLETLSQAIFIEMFGDPFHNPKDFPLIELSAACAAINDCPHSTPKWESEGLICLRTSNLGKGRWDWRDTRYVSPSTFEDRSKRGLLQPGDIVLSREGTVGVAACIEEGMVMCMGQRLVQVRADPEVVSPRYLLAVLLNLLRPIRISSLMVGSTASHLNVKDLRGLSIPVPPLPLQHQYLNAIEQLDIGGAVSERGGDQAKQLFASLQQKAFRGAL